MPTEKTGSFPAAPSLPCRMGTCAGTMVHKSRGWLADSWYCGSCKTWAYIPRNMMERIKEKK